MKLVIETRTSKPVFQQLVDQIHFAINMGTLKPGQKLPSIRALAAEYGIAADTVAKAFRQLEFRDVIEAKDRSGYLVKQSTINRYKARGVSADKSEVHAAISSLDAGVIPGAFCKITEDYLGGDPEKCNVIHSDGSGTKSIIAYLHYKETGDAKVFEGIAQDSIVMNLDDLMCIGINGRVVFSNTINRNALNCPGEVIDALINGSELFMSSMRDQGVEIYSGGGETADVGDLTGTIVVDSCAVTTMKKKDIVTNTIVPDLAIVGLSSAGQAYYEDTENSGIGSNGLTSARHDLLSPAYGDKYPETFDSNLQENLVYCGPYQLHEAFPNSKLKVGEALLSPTRSYAPVIMALLAELRPNIKGLIHCSGGAQTKCLNFGSGIHFIKQNMLSVPPIFMAIQAASHTSWHEMYKVFNMGHRMEVYISPKYVETVISIAKQYNVEAQQIGVTEEAKTNQLTLTDWSGNLQEYIK
ncbi:MAG: GntR family transcriptional regulator [Candidatus Azotimanducaceae bacterium]